MFSEHQGSKAYDLSSLQLSDSNPMQKILGVSKGVLEVKNLPAMQESPVWSLAPEDPLEEGHGNPLLYSYLENSKDRGSWWATVHRVAESLRQLKWLSTHTEDF